MCNVRLGYRPPYSSNDPAKYVKCFGQLENAEAISTPPSVIRIQDFLETGLLNQDDNHLPSIVEGRELVAFMLKWIDIEVDEAKPAKQTFQYVSDFQDKAFQLSMCCRLEAGIIPGRGRCRRQR
ncbi:MAG: hypothetical protein PHE96_03785 [Methylococcales bacterium]|nr:hypothetical protein [Methylococcales bacterium]